MFWILISATAFLAVLLTVCLAVVIKGLKTEKKQKTEFSENFLPKFGRNVSALRLNNIVKVYGQGENKVQALKNVSINFRKNEFVAVLGPSGCGKTTMLNIIGGLDRYTSGDLIINGVSTKEYKDADWDTYRNNSVGFVFQNYNLIMHQTVLSNVELALTLSGVSNKERKKRAMAVLEKVGLKEQRNKLPNQLSGGQMQRVAIARALVNDPEIILADEPTGALDTETSIQVMDLLKEVAKDRLVIMVTHNPDLADKYATRVINLLDGEMTGDTAALTDYVDDVKEFNDKGKAQMKLGTAFSLSLSNLKTKKGRTTLTSIAGSIGIIGIALVLAVSTGFSNYINKMQSETLSVYPVTVSESTVDITDFNKLLNKTGIEKFPSVKEVYTRKMFSSLTEMLKSNKITSEYVKFVEDYVKKENNAAAKTADKWKLCVQKFYGFDVNNYVFTEITYNNPLTGDKTPYIMPVDMFVKSLENYLKFVEDSNINMTTSMVRQYIPTMSEIPDNRDMMEAQYDVLEGRWAEKKDEVVLVVNSYNEINDITLALLGFKSVDKIEITPEGVNVSFSGTDSYTFEEIMQKKFYFVNNDERYTQFSNGYFQKFYKENTLPTDSKDFLSLKITGIVRVKKGVSNGVLDTGIAYTKAFTDHVKKSGLASNMATAVEGDGASVFNPLISTTVPQYYTKRQLALDGSISKISVFSIDYAAKEELKTYLDTWNSKEGRVTEDEVHYSDSMEMLFSTMNTIVDSVKTVLICFTAISLVVSSIMIGIITYVSVVERTKEIGVLRAIGARKKDISRIFNAETFLIGLFAGLFGVVVSFLLTVPINLVVSNFINASSIASLKITDALILVAVSFVLTLIAGVIPARIAAKKDPVVALRSE